MPWIIPETVKCGSRVRGCRSIVERSRGVRCRVNQLDHGWRERSVEYRRLGRTDIRIPPILFGGNVFGWTANETVSCQLLDELLAAGFNAIDTADMYATWVPGNSGGNLKP